MEIETIKKIKTTRGIKTIDIGNDEYLHFWYANNRGRGSNNITIVRSRDHRAALSAKQTDVLAVVRTSGWLGKINFSAEVRSQLGL